MRQCSIFRWNRLERFQAKWSPVRVEKTRQIKNLEPRFDSIETEMALGAAGRRRPSPAALEPGAEALVGGAERRFADRAGYADAIEQFLLGAGLTEPFVVGGGQRLTGDQAGAG